MTAMAKMSWNKAVMISLCLHAVILLVLAYTGLLNLKSEEPPNLELEIVDDVQLSPQQAQGVSLPAAAPREVSPEPVSQSVVRSEVATNVPLPFENVASTPTAAAQPSTGLTVTEPGVGTAPMARPSSGRILAPRILQKKDPVYPANATRQGLEGKVVLKIEVQVDGRAGEIIVVDSSGSEALDEAAVAAVRQWRFIPAREEDTGIPVRRFTTVPIVFEINR